MIAVAMQFDIILELQMMRLNEIMNSEPLTVDQIEKLSSHFNTYIQPHNQMKSRKHALVCYTTADREGAITEAETMIDSLQVQYNLNLTCLSISIPFHSSQI